MIMHGYIQTIISVYISLLYFSIFVIENPVFANSPATSTPSIGLNVAILLWKTEHYRKARRLERSSRPPRLIDLAICHFRDFGNIYTIFSVITRNKTAIYPAKLNWGKMVRFQKCPNSSLAILLLKRVFCAI